MFFVLGLIMDFRRRSIRLKGWNYGNEGIYFITIAVQNKLRLFGEIEEKGRTHRSARTNNVGKMIDYWWNEIPNHFGSVRLDDYVIMPDHFHGLLVIKDDLVGADRCVRPNLSKIIQWFKTMTTNNYFNGVKNENWPTVNKRLWQRNYYEEIIQSEPKYWAIKKYIQDNPKNWKPMG